MSLPSFSHEWFRKISFHAHNKHSSPIKYKEDEKLVITSETGMNQMYSFQDFVNIMNKN